MGQIEGFGFVEHKREDPGRRQGQFLNLFPNGIGHGTGNRSADVENRHFPSPFCPERTN